MKYSYDDIKEGLESCVMFGADGYFTDLRVDRETIPKGMYSYMIRHDDECGEPATLEKNVLVNFFGTFITDTVFVDLESGSFRNINDECLYFK